MNLSNLVPITAVVAVTIFLSKEVLEGRRRRQADSRKIDAIKRLLARDCELNAWTIKSLVQIYQKTQSEINEEYGYIYSVVREPSGKHIFKTDYPDGDPSGATPIPPVYRETISKHLLDIATLNEEFLHVAEAAYDALAEVQHVRDYLLGIEPNSPNSLDREIDMGLAEYALEELRDAKAPLDALYLFCTGKELTKHRLR